MTERKFLVRQVDFEKYSASELESENLRTRIKVGGDQFEAESLKKLGVMVGSNVPGAQVYFRFPHLKEGKLVESMKLEFRNGYGKGVSGVDEVD